jgi:hypothetical protein
MSETLNDYRTPQQRVFGNVFDLSNPSVHVDPDQLYVFQATRDETISDGATCWRPRDFEFEFVGYNKPTLKISEERIVKADLYRKRSVIVTLEFNQSTRLANLYASCALDESGRTVIGYEMSFDDAVIDAEEFANMLNNHPTLF